MSDKLDFTHLFMHNKGRFHAYCNLLLFAVFDKFLQIFGDVRDLFSEYSAYVLCVGETLHKFDFLM